MDIDRLHQVVAGDLSYQGCGKTFAKCHVIASAIELGEPVVTVALPVYRWMHHVVPMLVDVLAERGLGIPTWCSRSSLELPGGQLIRFVAAKRHERWVGDHSALVEVYQ